MVVTFARGKTRQTRGEPAGGAPGLGMVMPEITDAEFNQLSQLVYQHAGIHLPPQKKELVRSRLTKFLRNRKLTSFHEYYRQVLDDTSGLELIDLLDAISTNMTAFWREPKHFEFLGQELLPALRQKCNRTPQWRFWSAGCSSGEEPYTMAMVLLNAITDKDMSGVKIYASDINTQVLNQAQRGIYPLSRVEPLSPEWRRRFFQKGVNQFEGYVRVKPEVKQMVEFFRLNLMEPFPFKEGFDVIFCRNVMIYFEKSTQTELVRKFHHCLKPGGYLFIGHSESLCNISHQFAYVKPTIYRK
ncbi:MAG: protein-glutamate O-methyltransferase CheR [Thermodesulfobacteriota bacterium]